MIVRVVDMIPKSLSGESNQDSEPNLTVNPANPQQIAGSAFTPDPMGGSFAPIYVSVDGGTTWALNAIVPGGNSGTGTGDITLRFSGTSHLYVGDLRGDSFLRMNILRTGNFTSPTAMTILVDRTNEDQPYVQAATVAGGPDAGKDRVYIGNNNLGAGSQTATIDRSLDAATAPAPAGFNNFVVEARATSGQNGPPTRPAIHPDGTIYGVFYGWRAFVSGTITADVVVVRDDNWGTGPNPFSALTDPSDGLAGRLVATGLTIHAFPGALGMERLVNSDLSVGVDPRNSSVVYVAWCDHAGGPGPYTLRVRKSTDRGNTWTADLHTVQNAKNPALAVSINGTLGLLYQQVSGTGAGQRWATHLELTGNDWASPATNLVLADTPGSTPAPTFLPYLGDYVHLLAVGTTFYGIFSANNTPDLANFPHGVVYQRNANFTTHTLLANDNVTPVAVSIDPFFFKVSPLIKIWKEFKPEIKEIKEFLKEHKEPKELIKERKEFIKEIVKPEIDVKSIKEIKEKDKDLVEGPLGPDFGPLVELLGRMAERLDQLEERLANGRAFIRPEERPALGQDILREGQSRSE
jgi:Rieske Fe-S protein